MESKWVGGLAPGRRLCLPLPRGRWVRWKGGDGALFLWTQTPWMSWRSGSEMSPSPLPRSQSPHVNGLSRKGLFEAQALPSLPGAVWEVSSLSQDNRATGPSSCSYSGLWSAPPLPLAPASSLMGVAGWEQDSPVTWPWRGQAGEQVLSPSLTINSENLPLEPSLWVAQHGGSHSSGGGLRNHTEGERSQPSRCWRTSGFTPAGGRQPPSPAAPHRRWLVGRG